MADAKRDLNYEAVELAVTDNASLTPQPLLCESLLDYLEIDLVLIPSHTSTSVTAKEDENFEFVQLAYDASADEAKPLKVDASNGRLLLDLTYI